MATLTVNKAGEWVKLPIGSVRAQVSTANGAMIYTGTTAPATNEKGQFASQHQMWYMADDGRDDYVKAIVDNTEVEVQ